MQVVRCHPNLNSVIFSQLNGAPHVTGFALNAQDDLVVKILDMASSPSSQSYASAVILPALESFRLDFFFNHGMGGDTYLQTSVRRFVARSAALEEQGLSCASLRALSVPKFLELEDLSESIPTFETTFTDRSSAWPNAWADWPARILGPEKDFTLGADELEDNWEDEDDEDPDGLDAGADYDFEDYYDDYGPLSPGYVSDEYFPGDLLISETW